MEQVMNEVRSSRKQKEYFVKWKEGTSAARCKDKSTSYKSLSKNKRREVQTTPNSQHPMATESRLAKTLEQVFATALGTEKTCISTRRRGAVPEQSLETCKSGGSKKSIEPRRTLSSSTTKMIHGPCGCEGLHARHARRTEQSLPCTKVADDILSNVDGALCELSDYRPQSRTEGRSGEQREERMTRGEPNFWPKGAQRTNLVKKGTTSISSSKFKGCSDSAATARFSESSIKPCIAGHDELTGIKNDIAESNRENMTAEVEMVEFEDDCGDNREPLSHPGLEDDFAAPNIVDGVDIGSDINSKECEEDSDGTHTSGHNRRTSTFLFCNEDVSVDNSGDSKEVEHEDREEGDFRGEYGMIAVDVEGDTNSTETEKRRERGQKLAAWIREGDRRHSQGLPRNYLLVDEHRHEPYGQGVGSWRKELMLLSRRLDPAIGNINRQPEDVVKEVAEWIQHTWEYSRSVKWKVVKQVIARGVSLRRSDLWKKIRMGEAKPNDISDRTWRSLAREIESPAMKRKFRNCSKANACRNNFGRTGPSGAVGVRERLRKKLKRSPSPSEVRLEMARPKGYSRWSKQHLEVDNIMHRSGFSTVSAENPCTNPPYRNESGGREEIHLGNSTAAELERAPNVSSRVLSLSGEEVAQHPAFIRIMARLEAVEKKTTNTASEGDVQHEGSTVVPQGGEILKRLQTENEVPRQLGNGRRSQAGHRSRRVM